MYESEKMRVLGGEALGIFFVIALGLFFIFYGFAVMGIVPAFATGDEGQVSSAVAYTVLILLALATISAFTTARKARRKRRK